MSERKNINIHIIANATLGKSLSGGDRIFIECARRWSKMGYRVFVYVWEEGYELCKRNKLDGVNYIIWPVRKYKKYGFIVLYFIRILKGIVEAIRLSVLFPERTVIYSSSDFWMDSLPAWILKMKYKNVKWIAGFYLFAPNPFTRESPYKGKRFIKGLIYYFSQVPIYSLIKKFADMVWVTNEVDRWRFIDNKRLTPDNVIAVYGGVDIETVMLVPEPEKKEFDAVFIGRFHPAKGVLELIDIWKYVCERKNDAKLAMIGVGELEKEVKAKIVKYGLGNNIVLFGFKDGVEKLQIFKNSKIVVHPAIYDSGGMAACEAMACGLPGVSFDLPSLKTYYPKGMLKAPCYDLKAFAENILKLLNDVEMYKRLKKEALEFAKEWDWDRRAKELLKSIQKLINL